ncbi:WG repeat-containing protein [Gallibacterium trehalosifermentans]|uniref:WG repeat-containing protein n=1 Tax=Gallibacterium trehalosifermentans TaxID=516935 RepID=A0ABV6GZM0_9PAST
MKTYILLSVLICVLSGCTTQAQYRPYHFDNGEDYVVEGMVRIVDQQGRIGYADQEKKVIIPPRFVCAFPFENGRAKVADKGQIQEVLGSKGEYHYCQSDAWYYIDRQGNKVSDTE